jgi:hypothetical protein
MNANSQIDNFMPLSHIEATAAKIASILAIELAQQKYLAEQILLNPPSEEIAKLAQLTVDSIPEYVSLQQFRPREQSPTTYVNVWYESSTFGSLVEGANTGAQTGESTFVIEFCSAEIAPINSDSENPNIKPDYVGSAKANAQIDRLMLLCRWILQNAIYRYLDLEGIVANRSVRNANKTFPNDAQNGINRVMSMMNIIVNIAEVCADVDVTLDITEFYTKLNPVFLDENGHIASEGEMAFLIYHQQ